MGAMSSGFTIGELAGRCGVSRDTIRFYEREGLLPQPRRTPSRYRVYDSVAQERLAFIRRAQHIGFSLGDIRELLRIHQLRSPGECREVAARLRTRIDVIDGKIDGLVTLRRKLAASLRRCEDAEAESCPVVLDLAASTTNGLETPGDSHD